MKRRTSFVRCRDIPAHRFARMKGALRNLINNVTASSTCETGSHVYRIGIIEQLRTVAVKPPCRRLKRGCQTNSLLRYTDFSPTEPSDSKHRRITRTIVATHK